MNNMVVFECGEGVDGMLVEMDVHDIRGEKWVPAAVVGEALGIQNVRKTVAGLIENRELFENRHFCNLKLQQVGKVVQGRERLMLSYRGVIRVAMRSDGPRAVKFRDWAEEVLYGVMVGGAALPVGAGVKGMVSMYRDAAGLVRSMIAIGRALGQSKDKARRNAALRVSEVTGVSLSELVGEDFLTDPLCNVREFVDVCCVVKAGVSVSPVALYEAYKVWCGSVSKTPETRNSFYAKVCDWQPSVRRQQVGPTRERVFAGIGLVAGLF